MKNKSSISSESDDSKVGWDNHEAITKFNGDIRIKWSNTASLKNFNGDVKIGWSNTGGVENFNWNVVIESDNHSIVKTTNWDIKIWGVNTWSLTSDNWDIKAQENTMKWVMKSTNGTIKIGAIGLKLKKQGSYTNTIVSNTWSSISKVIVSNSSSVIINWKKISGDAWDSSNSDYTATIETLYFTCSINLIDGKVFVWWIEVMPSQTADVLIYKVDVHELIKVANEFRMNFQWQLISISKEVTMVESQGV